MMKNINEILIFLTILNLLVFLPQGISQIEYSLFTNNEDKEVLKLNSIEEIIIEYYDEENQKKSDFSLLFDKNGNLLKYRDEIEYTYKNNQLIHVNSILYNIQYNLKYDKFGRLVETKIKSEKPFKLMEETREFQIYSVDEIGEVDIAVYYLPKDDKEIIISNTYEDNKIEEIIKTESEYIYRTKTMYLNKKGNIEKTIISSFNGKTTPCYGFYTYDEQDNLISKMSRCEEPIGQIENTFRSLLIIDYDTNNNIIRKTDFLSTSFEDWKISHYSTYTYDANGKLVKIIAAPYQNTTPISIFYYNDICFGNEYIRYEYYDNGLLRDKTTYENGVKERVKYQYKKFKK